MLSGEGADEVLGGYLYFHKAPNKQEFHAETVRKLKDLHYYDCLRANKATMAWGVEVRVPFLDKGFLATALGFDPQEKVRSNRQYSSVALVSHSGFVFRCSSISDNKSCRCVEMAVLKSGACEKPSIRRMTRTCLMMFSGDRRSSFLMELDTTGSTHCGKLVRAAPLHHV